MDTYTQQIIEHLTEYAKELLEDTGEFYPFGAFIDAAGQIHPLEYEIEDKKNMPNNGVVIESLSNYCSAEFKSGKMLAYGLCYESEVLLERGKAPVDTITVDVASSLDEAIPVFYYPFSIRGESVRYGEAFAVKRT